MINYKTIDNKVSLSKSSLSQKLVMLDYLPDNLMSQLIHYSTHDDIILQFTSDSSRFNDIPAVRKWLEKKRAIYILTNLERTFLYGICWFGSAILPGDKSKLKAVADKKLFQLTLAKRIYGDMRGKSLAKPFVQSAFRKFLATEMYRQHYPFGFWVTTSKNNYININVNAAFGFDTVGHIVETNKIIQVATFDTIVKNITYMQNSTSIISLSNANRGML